MKRLSDLPGLLPACLLIFPVSLALGDAPEPAVPNVGTGELILGAPGVGLTYHTVEDMPFLVDANIGRYYKFEFTGIEVQADADGVPGSYGYDGYMWDGPKKTNNGHGNNVDGVDKSNPGKSKDGEDTDPTVDDEKKQYIVIGPNGEEVITNNPSVDLVPGWWEMWGQVNDVKANSVSFTTAALHELSGVLRLMLNNPVIFREEVIQLNWAGNGNSKDPDGHFYILGSAIKEPPVPFGGLTINQSYYKDGITPPFRWNVVRE